MPMLEDYFLNPDKLSSVLPGYHSRTTQIQAAGYINSALESYTDIVVEAPTGSGKTIAYLIPVYHQARRTIISTKSKQLMQQLILKDIPVMQKLFGERSVAMLKGRKNYFCPHRFMRWIYPNRQFYTDVVDWFNVQEDISEVPWGYFDPATVDRMTADRNQCLYNKCKYYTSCPYTRVKEGANAAQLVITNHHLILADIAMKSEGGYGAVFDHAEHIVFDEAHSIADTYAAFAGHELSLRRLVSLISDYREKLSVKSIHELSGRQQSLLSEMEAVDGKILYDSFQERFIPFMEFCAELVGAVDDEDLTNEFSHMDNAYKVLNSNESGLKYAEIRGRDLVLKYVPLKIGGDFLSGLRQSTLSSVFISATLSAGGDFDYFLRETGLEGENFQSVSLPSVFDFGKQAVLLVPKRAEPDTVIRAMAAGADSSVLIICNSVSRMKFIKSMLGDDYAGKAVFTQEDGDWSTFTGMGNIILIGCASLREGVDLAGGNFTCVIIDKLPFEYHKDLYLAEKAKVVEQTSGDSFNNFYLPRAVLYFKQAAGRLIRHESDRGVWVCLDERILTRNYGAKFLNVLDNVRVVRTVEEAINFLEY